MKQKAQIPQATHEQIIKTGIDVPQQHPAFAIALNQVGIANKTVWVKLPEGRIPFNAKLSVALQAEARGIHMSRMEQAISALYDRNFHQPSDYGETLLHEMVALQGCQSGQVTLTGKVPVQRTSLISRQTSNDSVDISCTVQVDPDKLTSLLGVGVCHITACPCTQEYNTDVFPEENGLCPKPTHSQRSQTMLTLERQGNNPTWQNILHCLEQSLHITQDLLKRPDEAEIVLQSHQQPQFAEDAVRETARQTAQLFADILPASNRVIIESLSLESIHIHDVTCRLDTTLSTISTIPA